MSENNGSTPGGDGAGSGQVQKRKRIWPYLLIVAGVLMVIGGFFYDVLFAGIPYQDPTPAMEKSYALHSLVASVIRWSGVGAFLLGVAGAVLGAFRKGTHPRA